MSESKAEIFVFVLHRWLPEADHQIAPLHEKGKAFSKYSKNSSSIVLNNMRLRRKPPIFRITLGKFGSRVGISDRDDE
jgi:hypothetical protein